MYNTYMMIKTIDLFGFVNDLKNIIYGLRFKLMLIRNNNDRALFRVIAVAGTIANDSSIEFIDISWCVPSIDPTNENRIIVRKGLKKKNNVDFSFYDRKAFYKNATNFKFHLGMESGRQIPQ